jgi:hypothetical protein
VNAISYFIEFIKANIEKKNETKAQELERNIKKSNEKIIESVEEKAFQNALSSKVSGKAILWTLNSAAISGIKYLIH